MSRLATGALVPRAAPEGSRPRVVALGGDGIGPEVVAAALTCIRATGAPLDIVEPPHGPSSLAEQGTAFPDDTRRACDEADAILFGACDKTSNVILRYLRLELDCYANLRPSVPLGEGETDLVIVREATEGMYPGREGDLSELAARWPEFRDGLGRPIPSEGRFAIRVITEPATARIARYAGRLAREREDAGRGEGRVTIVSKANVLRQTGKLFVETCRRELEAAGVQIDHLYVDEAARRLAACPETFDVIVTSNLFGDILSDVAAEAADGLPMAPSAGIGDAHAYFEPVHGSAPDIAGRGHANPSATILSAVLMLSYLGFSEQASRIEDAVAATVAAGPKTRDLGGDASTEEFTAAVCERLGPG